jgi:hypothetical protein
MVRPRAINGSPTPPRTPRVPSAMLVQMSSRSRSTWRSGGQPLAGWERFVDVVRLFGSADVAAGLSLAAVFDDCFVEQLLLVRLAPPVGRQERVMPSSAASSAACCTACRSFGFRLAIAGSSVS